MHEYALRLALTVVTLASGGLLLVLANDPARLAKDPALRLFTIPLIPELTYTLLEGVFLFFSLAGRSPPAFMMPLSDAVQMTLGITYVHYAYRTWQVNGVSFKGHLAIKWLIAATALNYLVYFMRYPLPAYQPFIQVATKSIQGAILLYAGWCALTARSIKKNFYPSSNAAFWMAFLVLVYMPLVGLVDMFGMSLPTAKLVRPLMQQLFPIRELVIITIYLFHTDPLYSWVKGLGRPALEPLSSREREVAVLLCKGYTNGLIARDLHISIPTVKTHVRSILRKTGSLTRAEFMHGFAAKPQKA